MKNEFFEQKKNMPKLEEVWGNILSNEGETFRQIRGGEFTYSAKGNVLFLDRTNRSITKNTVKEALKHVPLQNTVSLQNLQAPSYLYAILMDARIRNESW